MNLSKESCYTHAPHNSTLVEIPGFRTRRFPTKTYHGEEEIGIGNVTSLEPFIDMKNTGINLPVSCVIFRTQQIVTILLQEIEFKNQ